MFESPLGHHAEGQRQLSFLRGAPEAVRTRKCTSVKRGGSVNRRVASGSRRPRGEPQSGRVRSNLQNRLGARICKKWVWWLYPVWHPVWHPVRHPVRHPVLHPDGIPCIDNTAAFRVPVAEVIQIQKSIPDIPQRKGRDTVFRQNGDSGIPET